MHKQEAAVFMGDILSKKLVTAEGKTLGHVADIQLSDGPEYRITALFFGGRGWFYRLHLLNPFVSRKLLSNKPYVVSWEDIERIEQHAIVLKPGCPRQSSQTELADP
ncbi:PRC-barrel domain containing protein [Ktedonosporobacter rubrisoli]|uniref:PRC-barrel domain containing protein n=1 Tax=Ktedonosporobacter rubrisoli TaxID=2509675 RepID=A0A4P6JK77_KTERU|nr:PRC-barrel domain-containing protein [Ktedonosporobacter rubrisoli]QBD75370.1 PRC-barrel domain containing protein [Ktedonosporobacter rubrisoli]